MRRVLIVGAGGIVGQHLRLQQPADVDAIYTRRPRPEVFYMAGLDLTSAEDGPRLNAIVGNKWGGRVDVVINLAGENRPDVVERDPKKYRWVNVFLPQFLADWTNRRGALYIHISTQGVLGGYKAPYTRAALPTALTEIPAHEYGRQKLEAERWIERTATHWMILRLTYALGIRPFPGMGRPNPLESMFEDLAAGYKQRQVADRYFSPCFAEDAARAIWAAVQYPMIKTVWHVGTPVRTSRYGLALLAAEQGGDRDTITAVNHAEAFPDLPDRPLDTTYGDSARYWTELPQGMKRAYAQWQQRTTWYSTEDRGDELALFFGASNAETRARIAEGFGFNHGKVAEDWRRTNPKTDEDILRWYKETDAYCYELSAYHNDRGFNYLGMCTGIAQHLKREGATRVLCLGDGIGDLTLVLREHGLDPIYHDLGGSITSMFAAFRFWRRSATPLMLLTPDWKGPEEVHATSSGEETDPAGLLRPDAVVALDFFEHLPNVAEWAIAVAKLLKLGGWFLAQNAFGIGDEEHEGSIPMHLTRNNQYVTTWPILLDRVGFALDPAGSGWWRKIV